MVEFFTTANITDLLVVVVRVGMGTSRSTVCRLFTDSGLNGSAREVVRMRDAPFVSLGPGHSCST
jgi:hypothetical protein